MDTFSWIASEDFATRLTVTLLHFLWQGCVAGLVVLVIGAALHRASARLRYSIHVGTMLAMAACLPITFALMGKPDIDRNQPTASRPMRAIESPPAVSAETGDPPKEQVLPIVSESTSGSDSVVIFNPPPALEGEFADASSPNVSSVEIPFHRSRLFTFKAMSAISRWIAPLYLFGVALILARLLQGVWGGHRLRRMAIAIKDENLLTSFRKLALRVGMKAAPAIAWCEQISIPVVVGIVKPMILLPAALASSLTPDQLQALLLHELSHIRRFDPIMNLLQRVVEALLFFHPVVWFVSRRISLERELVADDMVLAAGWEKPLYADALVRVAEIAATISGSNSLRHATILGATGKSSSEFKHRVLRLLGESHPPKLDLLRGGLGAVLLLFVMGGVFAWSQSENRKAPEPKPAPTAVKPAPDVAQVKPVESETSEKDKESYNAYMKIMDFAPMSECKAAIKRLDDGGVTKLAAQSRERLAKRWKLISEQPVQTFLREIPKKDPSEGFERGGGDGIGVQTELDGVWSNGKGNADSWKDWIVRKQDDYREGRLQLLFEAAQGYRKIDDDASAKRALIAGLTGHEIFDEALKTLIEKYWPVKNDDPAKMMGSGPKAWTLVNFLDELSATQQALGEIDQAIITHSRLTLAHFMLSWKHPSSGPTEHARELWSLVRKKPESMPPLFWFNVVDEKNPTQKFDLSAAGQKEQMLTYHHQNLAAAPSLDFAELKITAKTCGTSGIFDCNRINREGKQESIGVLRPSAEGGSEQTLSGTFKIPPGTGLVQFLVAGEDFHVGEVTVEATFTKTAPPEAPKGVKTLRKPALLLPDHWIVRCVGFDNDEKELVTASTQSFVTIRRWDLVNQKLISEIKLEGDKHGRQFRAETLLLSGDRRRVIGATDEYVGIWSTSTGELLTKLPFPTKSGIYDCCIDRLDCTPNFSVIAGNWAMPGRLTLSYDAHVMIWDGVTGEVVQTVIDKGATDLKSIDLSTDGKRLATTNGGGATIWDTRTGEQLLHVNNDNTGRTHPDLEVTSNATTNVWSVQLSPNGEQLAFGDILGVKLVDTRSGKLLKQLEGPHRYGLGTLVFSPDGEWLARLGTEDSVAGGKTRDVVPIWSTRTGEKQFELYTEANDAAFSADGKRIAIGFSEMQQGLAIWTLGEGDAGTTQGPGPDSRVDKVEENGHYRGKVAAEYVERFKPTWSKATRGLAYGIALTKPQREYTIGERVPLVVFFRNTGDKPVKFDTQPDFYGNAPKVVDAKGAEILLDNGPLLGHIPHYHETLDPGEALGPLYLSFGLGENPRPRKQHWRPNIKTPQVGKYSLTHTVTVNVSEGDKDAAKTAAEIQSARVEFDIVEENAAKPRAK